MRLVGDYVAVKLADPETKTEGGIVLPDKAQEKVGKGVVKYVGPGLFSERHWKHIPMAVKVGQTIEFQKHAGHEIKIGGEELTVLRDGAVLAVIEEATK